MENMLTGSEATDSVNMGQIVGQTCESSQSATKQPHGACVVGHLSDAGADT